MGKTYERRGSRKEEVGSGMTCPHSGKWKFHENGGQEQDVTTSLVSQQAYKFLYSIWYSEVENIQKLKAFSDVDSFIGACPLVSFPSLEEELVLSLVPCQVLLVLKAAFLPWPGSPSSLVTAVLWWLRSNI